MAIDDPNETKSDPATGRPLAGKVDGVTEVRPAGSDAISDLPDDIANDWDETDQSVDESFPVSDPPGQGVD